MSTKEEQAIELRKNGLTYQQIANELGVSVDWCKKNLKGIKKTKHDPCIDEIITLGIRPEGITTYEMTGIIFKYYENANKNKIKYLKEKAESLEPKCLIHSGWIDTMKPNESHKAMNAFALHLMDQVDLMVGDYCEMYPNANKWSARYEMLKLAFSRQISPQPLSDRLYRNEVLAEAFEER